jgi:hypothetical protein
MRPSSITSSLFAIILPVLLLQHVEAFLSIQNGVKAPQTSPLKAIRGEPSNGVSEYRRALLQLPFQLALLTQIQSPALAAIGEMVKGKLTEEEAETKFIEGYKSICYLIDHYEEVCEGGGDSVRRQLGTIIGNPPSGLVGISKTMKALEDRADDFIEFTETSNEVITSINQADGSAYMSIFVTSSTSYTPPKKYFDDGLIEIKRCKKTMEDLAKMVNIKL